MDFTNSVRRRSSLISPLGSLNEEETHVTTERVPDRTEITTSTKPPVEGPDEICVTRPMLNIAKRRDSFHYGQPPNNGLATKIKKKIADSCKCSGACVKSIVLSRLPILTWLPSYNFQNSLLGDTVAGVTVAIMHIPQGMAYAVLAGLPPITGMYMAFFPVLLYAVLGTSRHCTMGTFAVVCLMTGKVVGRLATEQTSILEGNLMDTDDDDDHDDDHDDDDMRTMQTYSPNQVAAVVAMMVGIWKLLMGLLQLGSLSVFLSDMLVSGFTTGAAIHVLTSQVKHLFGLTVERYNGPLNIIYTYKDILRQIMNSNPACMVVSGITISVLTLNNELLKPWVKKRSKIPVPIELIVVSLGTVASYFGELNENYDMLVIGEIPTGLPEPMIPPMELIFDVVVDGLVIAIVAYTISFSMAKIFAKRHKYSVDATQELYAQGLSNIFGSFFGCGPISASLSRSLVQEAVGGVTQVASFVSCSLLLLVLLFIGPLFETLPSSILASMIVVALKGMFLQFDDLKRVWKLSPVDASIWLATFLGVVIIDIEYGLLIGVLTSLLVLLIRSQKLKVTRLGHIPNTDLYLDVTKYSSVVEVPKVSIFQSSGPLHFANSEHFRSTLVSVTGLVPFANAAVPRPVPQRQDSENDLSSQSTKGSNNGSVNDDTTSELSAATSVANLVINKNDSKMMMRQVSLSIPDVEWLVLEMSGISYIDSTGSTVLRQLYNDLKEDGIKLVLAGLSESVLERLQTTDLLTTVSDKYIFHSVHDAVTFITQYDPVTNASTDTPSVTAGDNNSAISRQI